MCERIYHDLFQPRWSPSLAVELVEECTQDSNSLASGLCEASSARCPPSIQNFIAVSVPPMRRYIFKNL